MRDYAKVAPTFWTRGSGKALRGDAEAQLVALYLFTAPSSNMIGLYHIALPIIAHETGLTSGGASKGLARAFQAGIVDYDEEAELVFLPEAAAYQIGDALSKGDKRIRGVERELLNIGDHRFTWAFIERYAAAYNLNADGIARALGHTSGAPSKPLPSPFQGASKPLPSQDQDQDQDQEQEQEQNTTHAGAHAGAHTHRGERTHPREAEATERAQGAAFGIVLPLPQPSPPEDAVKAKPAARESILEALSRYPSLSSLATPKFAGEVEGLLMGSGYKLPIVVQAIADVGFDIDPDTSETSARRMIRAYIQNAHVRSKSAATACPTSDAKDFDEWAERNLVPKLGSKWGHECGRMADHYAGLGEKRSNWRGVWNAWIENTKVPKIPGPHPRVARVLEQRRRKEEDAEREVNASEALTGQELAASIRGLIGGRKAANGG